RLSASRAARVVCRLHRTNLVRLALQLGPGERRKRRQQIVEFGAGALRRSGLFARKQDLNAPRVGNAHDRFGTAKAFELRNGERMRFAVVAQQPKSVTFTFDDGSDRRDEAAKLGNVFQTADAAATERPAGHAGLGSRRESVLNVYEQSVADGERRVTAGGEVLREERRAQ